MKVRGKLASVVLAVAMCALVVSPGVSVAKNRGSDTSAQRVIPVPADAWESDDTTDTASSLPAVSSHTLHSYTDTDLMLFTVEEDGTPYFFEAQITDGNDDFDLYMYLYEMSEYGELTEITSADDHGYWDTYSEFITATLDSGTYILEVCGYSDGDTGMYDLYWGEGYARRVYGSDRYKTATAISKLMYQQCTVSYDWGFSFDGVVIASGTNPADGLAGAPLAGLTGGPLMLSGVMGLTADTQSEIARILAPDLLYQGETATIYILGSTAAVPGVVEDQLAAMPVVGPAIESGQVEVVRLEGADRFGTAAEIAYEFEAQDPGRSRAYLVNAYAWPDAMSASALAVYDDALVLPTRLDALPAETVKVIDDLGLTDIVVVGSTAVVSQDVEDALGTLASVESVERVGGADRYETSLALAEYGIGYVGFDAYSFVLVSGEAFPDGVCAAGMIYGQKGYGIDGPVLLTRKAALSSTVVDFMDSWGAPDSLCYVIGSSNAVSDAALAQLNAYRLTGD